MSVRTRPGAVEGRSAEGLASSTARFAARAARVRRRPLTIAAWVTAALGVLALLGWAIWYSPVLAVRSVQVTGIPRSQAAGVVALARVPMRQPLARLDTMAVASRVVSDPTIAEVTVRRGWPSTVVLQVVPRTAVIAMRNPQGEVDLVDRNGLAFRSVSTPPSGVPLVSSATAAPGRDALAAAITVLATLSDTQRSHVSSVMVSSADLVRFRYGRTDVVWGGAQESPLKARVMTALLRHHPSVVDVSAPRTPVTR